MLDFMEYLQNAFYDVSQWDQDNSYSSLNATAKGVCNPRSSSPHSLSLSLSFQTSSSVPANSFPPHHRKNPALLDFETPRGLRLNVSSLSSPNFATSYTVGTVGYVDGSLSYLYSSLPLRGASSSKSKSKDAAPVVGLRDLVRGYRQIPELRSPDEKWWWELWRGGVRVDRRGWFFFSSAQERRYGPFPRSILSSSSLALDMVYVGVRMAKRMDSRDATRPFPSFFSSHLSDRLLIPIRQSTTLPLTQTNPPHRHPPLRTHVPPPLLPGSALPPTHLTQQATENLSGQRPKPQQQRRHSPSPTAERRRQAQHRIPVLHRRGPGGHSGALQLRFRSAEGCRFHHYRIFLYIYIHIYIFHNQSHYSLGRRSLHGRRRAILRHAEQERRREHGRPVRDFGPSRRVPVHDDADDESVDGEPVVDVCGPSGFQLGAVLAVRFQRLFVRKRC